MAGTRRTAERPLFPSGPSHPGETNHPPKRRTTSYDTADISRGLVPNFVKIVPSMAVSFYTFDTVHDFLARLANDEDEEDDYEA